MTRAAFWLVALSACGAPRATSVSIAPPPPARTAPPPRVAPAESPRVEVDTSSGSGESWTWTADGLPAISADGASVAYAYALDDGGRGFPSLYVGVLPVGGERERTTTVFTADEVSSGARDLSTKVQQRLAFANASLRGWTPMTAQIVGEYIVDAPQTLSVAGLDWIYREPKLVVRDHGRDVFSRALDVGPGKDDHCTYAGRVHVAAVDPTRRVFLVALEYSAPPDFCADQQVFRAFRY